MEPIENLLARLDNPKRTAKGKWIARCPAHADKSPSLSLAQGDDGRVLMRCWAGCDVRSITDAVGINLSDLFPQRLDQTVNAKPIRRP